MASKFFRVTGAAWALAWLCSGCQASLSGDPVTTDWLAVVTDDGAAESLIFELSNERDFWVEHYRYGARGVSVSGQLSDPELDAARGLLTVELRSLYAEDLIAEDDPWCVPNHVFFRFRDPLNPTDFGSRRHGFYCPGDPYLPETETMVAEFKALAFALLEANGGTAPPP